MIKKRVTTELFKKFGKIRRYSSRQFEEIPSPKSLPFIGTRLAFWAAGSSKNLHEYVDRRHQELGPIYTEQLGPVRAIFVADPDAIRNIFSQEGKYPVHIIPQPWVLFNEKHKYSRGLLFMNGEEWLEHRKAMNKILLKGDVKWIEDSCDRVIEDFIKDLKETTNGHQEVEDLDLRLYRTFLDVLVSLLLGSENYAKNKKVIKPLVKYLAVNVSSVFETTEKLQMLPADWALKLRLPQWISFEKSMEKALVGAYKLVDELNVICEDGCGLLSKMQDENIDADRIKAIVADLILAAADTTAYTMQWMLYLVARDVKIQEKIRAELPASNSSYIRNVLKETLRLYPVAPFITRFLPQQSSIAGYKIPPNTLVVMSIYTTGRDEKYFGKATDFHPERWERGNEKLATQQAASLPFAMGVRSCVGRKLAEYELQKMLGEMVENFDLELCNANKIKMVLKMIAVPSEPIRLKLKSIK